MKTIRNEILEAGQEVVMYMDTDWQGQIGGVARLVKQIDFSDHNTVRWEIIAKNVIPPVPLSVRNWWFGILDRTRLD